MNKYKGQVTVNDVSFRFSQNAKYKFCEIRGIEFSDIQSEIQKDEVAALRDLYLSAHLEYCRKFNEEAKIESKEDMMDMIEIDLDQDELKQINDALLASFTLSKEEKKGGEKSEKK